MTENLSSTHLWLIIIISLLLLTIFAFFIYGFFSKKSSKRIVLSYHDKKIIEKYSFRNAFFFSIINLIMSLLLSFSCFFIFHSPLTKEYWGNITLIIFNMIIYYLILKATLQTIDKKANILKKDTVCTSFFLYCLIFMILFNFFITLFIELLFKSKGLSNYLLLPFPIVGIVIVTFYLNKTYTSKNSNS